MPNYNYECQACNKVFEVTASIKDMEKGHFSCPKCGSVNTKRLFDGFGYCHGNSTNESSQSNCPTCPTCPNGICQL